MMSSFRYAFGPIAFSARHRIETMFTGALVITAPRNAQNVAAAPPMSFFIEHMLAAALMAKPPVSKTIPFPTNTIF